MNLPSYEVPDDVRIYRIDNTYQIVDQFLDLESSL